MTRVAIRDWGATTAVGLTSAASCAAIRARVSGFRERTVSLPPAEPQIVASVPARWRLRPTPADWLISLASRAIAECLRKERPRPERTVLMLAPPEEFRHHPGCDRASRRALIPRIEQKLGVRFHAASTLLPGGAAAVIRALDAAAQMIGNRDVDWCVVGGVDSLVNDVDLARLAAAGRLKDDSNPQGVVPGEGASFLLIGSRQRSEQVVLVTGVGVGHEPDSVLGGSYSLGQGLRQALEAAVSTTPGGEPAIDFVVSTFNGERYGAWELMIARPQFYRTRRERLQVIYPAMSVGETGTAAPGLAVIVAATAMCRGYAPGEIAMCEAASEEGLRSACMVSVSTEPPG